MFTLSKYSMSALPQNNNCGRPWKTYTHTYILFGTLSFLKIYNKVEINAQLTLEKAFLLRSQRCFQGNWHLLVTQTYIYISIYLKLQILKNNNCYSYLTGRRTGIISFCILGDLTMKCNLDLHIKLDTNNNKHVLF